MDKAPKCCHLECESFAKWDIYSAPYRPESNTQSCDAHLAELLDDASEHKIYPIEQATAPAQP